MTQKTESLADKRQTEKRSRDDPPPVTCMWHEVQQRRRLACMWHLNGCNCRHKH